MLEINIDQWAQKYKDDYDLAVKGAYPIYYEDDVKHTEKSPYFENISKVFQKRQYILQEEFVSIGIWKTKRQIRNYEKNSPELVERITREMFKAKTDCEKVAILIQTKKGNKELINFVKPSFP